MSFSLPRDGSLPRFIGDRYQRFSQGAKVLADDPAVIGAEHPFDSDCLSSFVVSVCEQGVLDRLSEPESDLVSMMFLLDYHNGPSRIAERLHHWTVDDHEAVAADRVWVVAGVLASMLAMLCERVAGLDAR
jgi:hypothetical protein